LAPYGLADGSIVGPPYRPLLSAKLTRDRAISGTHPVGAALLMDRGYEKRAR